MDIPRFDTEAGLRRHTRWQVGVRALLVALATALVAWLFYQAGLRQQEERLLDILQSRSALIEAMAGHAGSVHDISQRSERVWADTLAQLRAANRKFPGIGMTGEFTLAHREGEQIIFLLRHRHDRLVPPEAVGFNSGLAEPMRRALMGEAGTLQGPDYRGDTVLAAYRPIPELGWGIVAKIDMDEIRAPYIYVGTVAVVLATLLVSGSAFFALRSLRPLITTLRLNESRYRLLVENQRDLVVSFDPQLQLTFVSDNYCQTFGRSREELLSGSFFPLVHHGDRDSVQASLEALFSPPYSTDHEERALTVDGWRWFHWSDRALLDENGEVVEIVAVGRDVTERKRQEERLNWLAQHDGLTHLPNRTFFEEHCVRALARARRSGECLAFLFIDLDHFKAVNDELGHSVGDAMLQAAAQRLQGMVREQDTVTRLGGDEFMILLEDIAERDDARLVAEKALNALSRPYEIEGHSIRCGASAGVAIYPDDGNDVAGLVEKADAAMYQAKRQGRGRIAFTSY